MRSALSSIIVFVFLLALVGGSTANALSPEQRRVIDSGAYYFNVEASAVSCSFQGSVTAEQNNLDYAGREIITEAQLAAISQNAPIYQQAASQVDIPWQMIAAIHLKEFGLKRENPSNGQGVYQFVNKQGGPYPTGPVSDDEFLRQTVLAAEFIKSKANSNYQNNRNLTSSATPETVKDTFFGYNGRNSGYSDQAATLGFDRDTQGYEGSPYVMNKADAQRDPDINRTTWGQVKRDFGPIEYPANSGYGAFLIYASVAGIPINCASAGSFVWPESHSTRVTSCFGPRIHPINGVPSEHRGIDLVGGEGTPILAAASGTVVRAGPASGYGPYFVVIEHPNGYGTSYGHMRSMSVRVGDQVSQGQQIGEEGNEGQSTGSHLHFSLFPGKYDGSDSKNVNPLQNGLTVPDGVSNPKNCQ